MGRVRRADLREQRGLTYIDVLATTIALTIIAIAVTAALGVLFKTARNSEPSAIGRTAVSNAQADFNAIAMYDPNAVTKITPGQTFSMQAPAPVAGVAYPPSDSQPSTLTVENVTPEGLGAAAQIELNYAVPGSAGSTNLTGDASISVFQKAPNGCQAALVGVAGTGC